MAKNQDPAEPRPPAPTEESLPLYEAARAAHAAGRSLHTCSVVIATTIGSQSLSLRGGKRGARGQQWDPAPLIEAIEAVGWRLDQLDHTWHQTEHNGALTGGAVALIAGITTAHMLFRRA